MKRGQVFISYAREDIDSAQKIFLELKREGLSPWMDKPPKPYENFGLLPGEIWNVRLKSEIKKSQFLIAILSNSSVEKRGYVQREFKLALDLMNEIPSSSLFLFPLLLDDCNVPELIIGTISFHDLNWHHYNNGGLKPIIISMRRVLMNLPKTEFIEKSNYDKKPIILRKPPKEDENKATPIYLQAREGENIFSPIIRWKLFIGKQKWKNNPLLYGDKVIVGSAGVAWNASDEFDGIYALSRFNGEVIWKVKTNGDANEVILSQDKVYLGTDAGEIFCINAETGIVIWCRTFEGEFHTRFQICKSNNFPFTILVFDFYGALLLLEPKNGDLVDGIKTKFNFRSSAVSIGNDRYAVVSQNGSILKIKIDDNIKIDEFIKMDTEVYSTPIFINKSNSLIVGSAGLSYFNNEKLRSFNLDSGELNWINSDDFPTGNIRANLTLHDDSIYLGCTYSNRLIRVDTETGKVTGEIELGVEKFPQWSAPFCSNDYIFLPRDDGYIYQVLLKTFKLKSKVKLFDENQVSVPSSGIEQISQSLDIKWRSIFYSTPIVQNEQLYIGNDDGFFYRVDF